MKINPGPKGIKSWTDTEREHALRLSQGGMSPAEVYLSLTTDRCIRYEAALTKIAEQKTLGELSEAGEDNEGDFEGAYDALIAEARLSLQPQT